VGDVASHENPLIRPAAELWVEICSALLRGLNHLLSNRVSALGAVATLLDPSEDPDEEMVRALGVEVGRLDRTLRLMRFMPRDERSTPEPVRVEELLPEIVAIHEHHPELREVRCAIAARGTGKGEGDAAGSDADAANGGGVRVDLGDLPPVWVSPNAFVHAGLVLLTGAKALVSGGRGAGGGGSDSAGTAGGAVISVSVDGGWLVVRIAASGADTLVRQAGRSSHARAAAWLLDCAPAGNGVGSGASVVADVSDLMAAGADDDAPPAGYELRLITLAERRRRERAG
jgi:hypothetical protein